MQLHFEVEGAGYPLIILHGLLGSRENWRSQTKIFSRFYRVFALDLRNHGRSPHSEVFNFDVMTQDLREFMEQLEVATAHVLGHSLGGKVAMQLAADQPERVSKLIVMDIAPKAYKGEHGAILEAMAGIDLERLQSRSDAELALASKIPDLATRRFVLKNLARDERRKLRWRVNLEAIHKNDGQTLKALALRRTFGKPALFVRGENSRYIQDQDAGTIRRFFPRAEIMTIPRAGHWVHIDAPDEFQRVVLSFLARN